MDFYGPSFDLHLATGVIYAIIAAVTFISGLKAYGRARWGAR